MHVVDYKSTAGRKNEEGTAAEYKPNWNLQTSLSSSNGYVSMDFKANGFNVSNVGYFVYVNGDQHLKMAYLRQSRIRHA